MACDQNLSTIKKFLQNKKSPVTTKSPIGIGRSKKKQTNSQFDSGEVFSKV